MTRFSLLNPAAKVNPTNTAIALHEAMDGIGTDDKVVNDIMNSLRLMKCYQWLQHIAIKIYQEAEAPEEDIKGEGALTPGLEVKEANTCQD
ncbi:MAG: annexin [Desulfobacterales bacterium]|nr:annexin [Desulfobacterales bacterium]